MNVHSLYTKIFDPGVEPLPELLQLNAIEDGHTMGDKLKAYVATKFTPQQLDALNDARRAGWLIRVVGGYSGHEPIWIERLGDEYPGREYCGTRYWSRGNAAEKKKFNKRRPYFLVTRSKQDQGMVLNVVTFPSKEYVQQVAGLVVAAFKYEIVPAVPDAPALRLEVKCFSPLEQGVGEWTGLRAAVASIPKHELERGIVLFGYVEEVQGVLDSSDDKFTSLCLPGCNERAVDRIFEIKAFAHNSKNFSLFLFGFDHTYWGSASALLLKEFLDAGIKHAFYFAKLGGRAILNGSAYRPLSTDAVTGALTAPRGPFFHLKFDGGRKQYISLGSFSPRQLLPEWHFSLRDCKVTVTRAHLSVPSVIGETRVQEAVYHSTNPTTVDNEISYMAEMVDEMQSKATLDCLHYVTDFVTPAYATSMTAHGGLDRDTREKKADKLAYGARFLIDCILEVNKESAPVIKPVEPRQGAPGKWLPSTRDYMSVFGMEPRDYRPWLVPREEYEVLRSAPVDRQAILAAAIANDARRTTTPLLQAATDLARPDINISGPPGAGKSMVARALYYELLYRFQHRVTPFRPFLIELKKLEAVIIKDPRCSTLEQQREFVASEFATITQMIQVEAAVGPLIVIVNGIDTSSPMYSWLQPSLSEWRGAARGSSGRLIACWRDSAWLSGEMEEERSLDNSYRVKIDVSALTPGSRLLDAICRIHKCSPQQFTDARQIARNATSESSPTLRIVAHIVQGKARGEYFHDITRRHFGDEHSSEAARIAYLLVTDPKRTAEFPLNARRRLVTGSDEITAHFAANHIYEFIHGLGKPSIELDTTQLEEMDRVFPHRITLQLKRKATGSNSIERSTALAIKRIWEKLNDTVDPICFRHFKSVLMFLCGRFKKSENAVDMGKKLLERALKSVGDGDMSPGALCLHRTSHISLMMLGDDGDRYFRYLRRKPEYDELNRGFDLTFYGDQKYCSDTRMDWPDHGGKFSEIYRTLQEMIGSSRNQNAVHAMNAYTIISLFVNRFQRKKLTETVPHDEALTVLRDLEQNKWLPQVVRSYARWAHHYLDTGVSIFVQALIGLKRERRANWNSKGRSVNVAESVADHTMSAVLLAEMFLPEDEKDLHADDQKLGRYSKGAVVRMLKVHDLAEGLLGDKINTQRSPEDDLEELHLIVAMAAISAAGGSPSPAHGCAGMEDALTEFIKGETLNAKLARQLDKLENLLQLVVYDRDPHAQIPDHADFRNGLIRKLKTRTVLNLWQSLSQELSEKEIEHMTNTHLTLDERRRPMIA